MKSRAMMVGHEYTYNIKAEERGKASANLTTLEESLNIDCWDRDFALSQCKLCQETFNVLLANAVVEITPKSSTASRVIYSVLTSDKMKNALTDEEYDANTSEILAAYKEA